MLGKDLIAPGYDDAMTTILAFVPRELDEQTDRDSVYSLKVLMRKMESYQCRLLGGALATWGTRVLNEMPVLTVPYLERKDEPSLISGQ